MNPYGITQFDANSAIAAYDNGRAQRAAEIKARQDEEKARLAKEQDDKKAAAMAKFAAPPSQQQTPSAQPSAQNAAAPQMNPLYDPAKRDALLREMTTIDPESAMKLADGFAKMDKDRMTQVSDTYKNLGVAAFQIRQLPPQDRAQALQQLAPQLAQMGLTQDQIAGLDLSDRGLELQIGQIRDIEKLIDSTTPTVVPVSGVGLFPVTPGSPYPQYGGQATGQAPTQQMPQTTAPVASELEYTKGELNAGRMMTFEQAQAVGMDKAASLGVPIVREMGGKLYFMINGQWFDNPGGR